MTNFYRRCLFSVFLVLGISVSQAVAQISFVKTIGTASSTSTGTSLSVTVSAAGVAAGNSVIVSLAFDPASGTVSCSDTRGNTYAVDKDTTTGSGTSGVRAVILSAHNITALTSSNTITCTHPSAAARALGANEFSGLAASGTQDKTSSGTGNSTSASSGSTQTTTQASELLLGTIGVEGKSNETFTAGSGYTTIGRVGTNQGAAASNITVNPEYQLVSATGAYSATGSLSNSTKWAAAVVTYKAAISSATKLTITSINGGNNPTAGVGFNVVVQAQDASGNPANVTANTNINLTRTGGTGSLGGTTTGTIAAGTNQVTISGTAYTKAESGVVITANVTSGDSLTSGSSAPFTVNPGTATTLAFITQPGNATAGGSISGPPTIVVQDSLGNTVTSSTASITVAIGTNPGGGTLSGTTTKNASSGTASFSGLSINKAGTGYTLTSSATGLSGATSATFNITAAAASKVAFTTQPANATAGSSIGGPPTVTVQDTFGNTVTSSSASITIAIGTNPGGGALSGTITKNASSGVATFSDLSINKSGTAYTLTASATGLTGATGANFNISAAAAATLAFTVDPANSTVGGTIPGPPTVTVQDTFGNTVTTSSASITVAIGINPGNGTLSGTVTKNASSGVTAFSDLSINRSGTGYTLTASSTGLANAASGKFDISGGTAATLAFSVHPNNSIAGEAIPGPPTVTVQDDFGNTVTSSTETITIDLSNNSNGGVVSGTTSKNAIAGVASFPDLSVNKVGSEYTLLASSGGLAAYWKFDEGSTNVTTADSSGHNNNGIITGATWTSDSKSGQALSFNGSGGQYVEMPTSSSLNPTNGITISAWLKRDDSAPQNDSPRIVDKHSSNHGPYQLFLYSTTKHLGARLQGPASNSGDIDSGWLVPAGQWAHVAMTYDGANIRFYGNGVLRFTQPYTGGLYNSDQENVVIGAAVNHLTGFFHGIIDEVRIYNRGLSDTEITQLYSCSGTGCGLTSGISSAFIVTPGSATKVAFITQPGDATPGSPIPGPVRVAVQDSSGNTVTSSSAAITIAIGNNPVGAVLGGTTIRNAVAGVATFSDLNVDKFANGYTLTAASTGLTGDTSTEFSITTQSLLGLGAYWKFDEGSGSTAADSSGHNNNGTITGTAWTTDSKTGQALSFSGSSGQYVEVPTSASLTPTSGITISAWIKRNSTGPQNQWPRIIDKHTSGHGPYQIYLYNNTNHLGAFFQGTSSTSGDVDSGWLVPAGQWTHIAVTYDGANIRFYGNGALQFTKSYTGGIYNSQQENVVIGAAVNHGSGFFNGIIDEVRISNRAFSDAEITQLYACGASVCGTVAGTVSRSSDGSPISGALVEVLQSGVVASAATGALGTYSLADIAPGSYSVRASATGFTTQTQSGVTVNGGANSTVNFSLDASQGGGGGGGAGIAYIYDRINRLRAVVDPASDTAIYNFDAVGNVVSIQRQPSSTVAIIETSTISAPTGTTVRIYGTGFSTTPSQNTVSFNGTAATVVSSTSTQIVTSVPAGATTGPINITAPGGSASTAGNFAVTATNGAPTITSFTPSVGEPNASVSILGSNFETAPANNRVTFNIARAYGFTATATNITTVVPDNATSGRISVTTPLGQGTSSADFFVPPFKQAVSDVGFTGRMNIGGNSTVNISSGNKMGLVVFDGTQGQSIKLTVSNVTFAHDVAVHLQAPDGKSLAVAAISNAGATFPSVVLPVTGTYTIAVIPRILTRISGGYGGGDGGPATSAHIDGPSGLTLDGQGNLYFADYYNSRIRKIDANGLIAPVAGDGNPTYGGDGFQATFAQLSFPWSVTADNQGNLFIADFDNSRVRKVNSSGIITTIAGTGGFGFTGDGGAAIAAQLNGPSAIAVDGQGNIFIADYNNHRIRKISPTGIITTIAGTGTGGYAGDGGLAVNAQINRPSGLAVDGQGNLFLADYFNHRVRKVDVGGVISTVAGNGTAGFSGDNGAASNAQLNFPSGVSLDNQGNLFIADRNNNRVRKVDSLGIISTVAGNGTFGFAGDGGPATTAQLKEPWAIVVDAAGNLYISDELNDRVRKVNTSGVITSIAGTDDVGDGGLAKNALIDYPTGIAADPQGNIYVADYGLSRIRKIAPTGLITTIAGNGVDGDAGDGGPATSAQINGPWQLALDGSGNLYITDSFNSRIRKVATNGIITTIAGNGTDGFSGDGGPATSAQLNGAEGVVVDSAGNVYIADTFNHRVRKVDPTGTITTIAGTGTRGYNGDNIPATTAQLYYPIGLALDSNNNLYIADDSNNRIRKVNTAGVITTVAGNGTFGFGGENIPAVNSGLSFPQGVAVDAQGTLYIAEEKNRVLQVDPNGIISTLTGTGVYGYNGDNIVPRIASVAFPTHVVVDGQGNIFIADSDNFLFRGIFANSTGSLTLTLTTP